MKKVPEVGDRIILKEFSFNTKAGGTGLSSSDFNEKYTAPVTAAVIKEWNDSECGQRGWALPLQTDAYLQRNAAEGSYNDKLEWDNSPGLFILYWSEFDIIDVN